MKKNILTALSFLAAFAFELCAAENIQVLKNLEIPANKQVYTDMFKLEKGKKYEFSGVALCEKNISHIAMEVRLFDINRRIIHPHLVNAAKGTEAKLVKPAVKGEKSFVIENNPKWLNNKRYILAAFNAKTDLSDLPNRFCEYYVRKCEKTAEGLKITLSRPLSRNYPANMLVRLHGDAGWMRFNPAVIGASVKGVPFKLSAEWAKTPGHDPFRIWEGAAYARIYCKSKGSCKLENMKITALDISADK